MSFSVTTNNVTGYMLSISAKTGADLTNSVAGTSFTSLNAADGIDSTTFDTTTYNNQWGFKPNYYKSTANSDKFYPSPTTSGVTLNKTESANASGSSDTYTIAISARATYSQVAGTYSNTYILNAVGNYPEYKITYNDASGEGSDLPSTQEATSETNDKTTINFSDIIPTRDGYEFVGWCSADNSADPTSCSGITYAAGDEYALSTLYSNIVPLYAIWRKTGPTKLYDKIASMSKGAQTATDLQATITTPTSSAPVSSNSGVYEYNSSVFGTSSDASNDYNIYYYRGILDTYSGMGSYGSDGQADAYPNYVKLANNTCWRIVRTTGSGGVKMIYNGTYGATTSGSCANSQTNAQVGTSAFDTTANSSGKSIVGIGYTYNASYKSTTTAAAYSTLFGTNSSYSGNSTNSSVKTYIEDTWYESNMGSTYTILLEPNAGYCNDRTVYNTSGSQITGSTTISTPYYASGSSATQYNFGARIRVGYGSVAKAPSLTCPRSTADLYTTSSASSGNKQLTYPTALLTADEVSLAGSGYSGLLAYHANSYLRSGPQFLLLSPDVRGSGGNAATYRLYPGGYLGSYPLNVTGGVRPAISLIPGTLIYSGSGTATDPWTVQPAISDITYMQDINSGNKASIVASMTENEQYQLLDNRDGKKYYFAKLETDVSAPGGAVEENGRYYQVWMTQNLDLCIGCAGVAALTSENTDLHTYNSGIYTSSTGYSYSNGIITWTPASTTITSSHTISGTTVSSGFDTSSTGYKVPYSAEGGDYYVVTSGSASDDTVTDDCTSGATICPHYHRGNYYNWSAAVASNNTSNLTTNYTKADNSICPAGWTLPYSAIASSGYPDSSYLLKQQGIIAGLVGSAATATWTTDGSIKIREAPLYFVHAGNIGGDSLSSPGYYGSYWSGTVVNASYASKLSFSNGITPADGAYRSSGGSIRCLVR